MTKIKNTVSAICIMNFRFVQLREDSRKCDQIKDLEHLRNLVFGAGDLGFSGSAGDRYLPEPVPLCSRFRALGRYLFGRYGHRNRLPLNGIDRAAKPNNHRHCYSVAKPDWHHWS